eukprot:TRINITY_DN5616_c0_g2_i1.p3 TRINITY_DN5616_c0_g2~~TRINITY_DN5616_c0_g2_i1.p3  ORF type:complete len:106 (-),score=17.48 TRINITY_DN5616_c0_g2_i1:691-1008(-)
MDSEVMEVVPFEDALSQIMDMIKPKIETAITIIEIKQSGLAPFLFNIIFNLNKFIEDENLYPLPSVSSEQGDITDWYKFAYRQYDLALMMEGDSQSSGSSSDEEV